MLPIARAAMVVGLFIGIALVGAFASNSQALSLDDAVKQALKNNPELLVETSSQEAQVEALNRAHAGYYPRIDVQAAVGPESSDNPTTRALGTPGTVDLTRREAALTIQQNLFDGFATEAEVALRTAQLDWATNRIQGTAENIALRTARVYLNLLRTDALVSLSLDLESTHLRIQQQVRQRSQSGVMGTADLDQVAARLALVQANLIADRRLRQDAAINYERLVGEPPGGDLQVPQLKADALPATLEQALEITRRSHPTLASANASISASRAEYHGAAQPYYPRIDLVLQGTWGKDLDGLEGLNRDTSLLLRLNYNLFNGGADIARRNQAAAQIGEATHARSRVERQIVENLRLAWTLHQTADARLAALRQSVAASSRTRDAYGQQFGVGKRSLLDLLDSENEVYQARRAEVNGVFEQRVAAFEVLEGMGKLLPAMEITYP
ncbi:MAG TPA: TolC family outer membrane protein [bacterium]|nr:TolC family outer membrane protein [bacterium]